MLVVLHTQSLTHSGESGYARGMKERGREREKEARSFVYQTVTVATGTRKVVSCMIIK